MSVAITSLIWAMDLPAMDKIVLLRLADFADSDGRNIWPSVERVHLECGVSERHARSVIKKFTASGLLILVSPGGGRNRSAEYRMNLDTLRAFPGGWFFSALTGGGGLRHLGRWKGTENPDRPESGSRPVSSCGYFHARILPGHAPLWRGGEEYNTRKGNNSAQSLISFWSGLLGFQPPAARMVLKSRAGGALVQKGIAP